MNNRNTINLRGLVETEVLVDIAIKTTENLLKLYPVFGAGGGNLSRDVVRSIFDVKIKVEAEVLLPGISNEFAGLPATIEGSVNALQMRTSHKYVSGWDHLNDHESSPYNLHQLVSVHRNTEDGYEGEIVVRIEDVEAGGFLGHEGAKLDEEKLLELERLISDTIGGSSCQHEHDCCGCMTHCVNGLSQFSGEYFTVSVSGFRNF